MESKHFLHAYELMHQSLVNLEMDRTFNSIGSNIFFEFGEQKEEVLPNGRKHLQKEWCIWIGASSWRITKSNKYIAGSGDFSEAIKLNIQKLLGKHFQSLSFLSQFLDAEFNFEDEYQVTTFFNWTEENQWTVFLSDKSNIGVDGSNEEGIKNAKNIASHFQIKENHKKLDMPIQGCTVNSISYNENNLPIFYFKEDCSINLNFCAWRLERNSDYVIGCLDDDNPKNALLQLIGKKITQIDIANPMMDARFQFEDGLILKTFTCCHAEEQWKIFRNGAVLFSANIEC